MSYGYDMTKAMAENKREAEQLHRRELAAQLLVAIIGTSGAVTSTDPYKALEAQVDRALRYADALIARTK